MLPFFSSTTEALQKWKCFYILHKAKRPYIPLFVFRGKLGTKKVGVNQSPFFSFFFGQHSWVWPRLLSICFCALWTAMKSHRVACALFMVWLVLMVELQMQWQCKEGPLREQERVPSSRATCCFSLQAAVQLERNYIKNKWRGNGLKTRLCPSCKWDDKVYVESWNSLNDKCPLMQPCKHHRKCVRR